MLVTRGEAPGGEAGGEMLLLYFSQWHETPALYDGQIGGSRQLFLPIF